MINNFIKNNFTIIISTLSLKSVSKVLNVPDGPFVIVRRCGTSFQPHRVDGYSVVVAHSVVVAYSVVVE